MNNTDRVRYIRIPRYQDGRGYFSETLNLSKPEFEELGDYKQSNFSMNRKYVLRGLHYQLENPQGKLIQVLTGAVYDFVIDLRKSSSTYLQLDVFYLSGNREMALWVPPGYAHGFLTLAEDTIFQYHVFGHGWVKGDEYHINAMEVYGISKIVNSIVDSTDKLRLSEKDAVSSPLELSTKYE